MRFVTCGSSMLSADSFSSRAHCGVPGAHHHAAAEAEGDEGGLAGVAAGLGHPPRRGAAAGCAVSNTVKSPTKPDTPSKRPRPSSKTVSGAALVRTTFVRSPSASSRRRGVGSLITAPLSFTVA